MLCTDNRNYGVCYYLEIWIAGEVLRVRRQLSPGIGFLAPEALWWVLAPPLWPWLETWLLGLLVYKTIILKVCFNPDLSVWEIRYWPSVCFHILGPRWSGTSWPEKSLVLVHVLWTSIYACRCHSRRGIPVQIFCTSSKWKNTKTIFAFSSCVLEN